ncbi:hypothetical protein KCU85_g420, partial [Aureobasidium melanogenum]
MAPPSSSSDMGMSSPSPSNSSSMSSGLNISSSSSGTLLSSSCGSTMRQRVEMFFGADKSSSTLHCLLGVTQKLSFAHPFRVPHVLLALPCASCQ